MLERHKRTVAAAAVALLAIAGGGAAIAATGGSTPRQEGQAAVDDAAKQLGITSSQLSSALKKALQNRVDAAVEAGRLTEEQGEQLKARIQSGDVPLLGIGPGPGHRHGAPPGLDAAASYLDLTEGELRTSLQSGTTLAELAQEQGKSVDGLVDAMVQAAKERIDGDVEAGRLTEEQAQQLLDDLEQHINDLVNGELPERPGPRFHPAGPPSLGAEPDMGAAA